MGQIPPLAVVAITLACVFLTERNAYAQASAPPPPSSSQTGTRATTLPKAETGLIYVSNKTMMSVTVKIDQLIDINGKTQTFEGSSWTLSPGTTKLTSKGSELRGSKAKIKFTRGGWTMTITASKPDEKGRLLVTIDDDDLRVEKLPTLRSSERDAFRSAVTKASKASNGSSSKRDDLIAEEIEKHSKTAAEEKAAREGISKSNSRYQSFVKDATWEYACAFHRVAREATRSADVETASKTPGIGKSTSSLPRSKEDEAKLRAALELLAKTGSEGKPSKPKSTPVAQPPTSKMPTASVTPMPVRKITGSLALDDVTADFHNLTNHEITIKVYWAEIKELGNVKLRDISHQDKNPAFAGYGSLTLKPNERRRFKWESPPSGKSISFESKIPKFDLGGKTEHIQIGGDVVVGSISYSEKSGPVKVVRMRWERKQGYAFYIPIETGSLRSPRTSLTVADSRRFDDMIPKPPVVRYVEPTATTLRVGATVRSRSGAFGAGGYWSGRVVSVSDGSCKVKIFNQIGSGYKLLQTYVFFPSDLVIDLSGD